MRSLSPSTISGEAPGNLILGFPRIFLGHWLPNAYQPLCSESLEFESFSLFPALHKASIFHVSQSVFPHQQSSMLHQTVGRALAGKGEALLVTD